MWRGFGGFSVGKHLMAYSEKYQKADSTSGFCTYRIAWHMLKRGISLWLEYRTALLLPVHHNPIV